MARQMIRTPFLATSIPMHRSTRPADCAAWVYAQTRRTPAKEGVCTTAQGYQLGKTKVFLRAGQMAQLDKLRTELMGSSATTIQRHVRGLLRRRQYQRIRRATVRLQVPNKSRVQPSLQPRSGLCLALKSLPRIPKLV